VLVPEMPLIVVFILENLATLRTLYLSVLHELPSFVEVQTVVLIYLLQLAEWTSRR